MYHISDLKKYVRCPRLYLNDRNAPKKEYQPFVRLDEAVTDLAAIKLGVTEHFLGNRGDSPELALDALQHYDWLVKARFEYRQLRIKVPFLHRNGDGWDLYFLFTGLNPHADDIQFYCDTVWVLENNDIIIKNISVIHLNGSYVRKGELDPHQLFVVSDYFYNSKNNPTVNIRNAIYNRMKDLSDILDEMDECTEETVGRPIRTNRCSARQKCTYYEQCFPDEKEEESNSIITLIASQHRYAMKNEGLLYLRDADISRIEGSKQQYAQIMADKSPNGRFVDRLALRSWMTSIEFPITFLDFEWERFAIPPYEGMKPYDVLPFEYSIHILEEDGTVRHIDYLSVHDDRRDMAESLIRDIPETGSVMAYNAAGAEVIRIREMADNFPDLAEKLLNINARMEDLQQPFENGVVYDVRMRGFWSLKVLMSMMDDPGYNSLDIRHGMDAVFQWRHLDYDETADEEERNRIIEELKAYCGMDSYAMTVVFKWLITLADEDV